jgi:hypothetical protein
MESMDIDPKAFDKTIHVVQSNNKFNTTKKLVKYIISPKLKAKMNIPLCHMVPMPIIHLTFKSICLKWNKHLQMRFQKGNKLFYVFFTNWQG